MSDEGERAQALDRLERALGYVFDDRGLLENALSHSSYVHELEAAGDSKTGHNERLEFLGDAILGFIVAHALYAAKPDWREGKLSRALHALVEGRSLVRLARSLELGAVLRLGRTELSSGGPDKPSILENAMEAVIGAIYLDGGLEAATDFVERAFAEALASDASPVRRDPKTELQERLMAEKGEFPRYRVVGDSGLEGDDERFTVEVVLGDDVLGRGVGRKKRTAERRAAAEAIVRRPAEGADGEAIDV